MKRKLGVIKRIIVATSLECNLSCEYCYEKELKKDIGATIPDTEKINKTMEELKGSYGFATDIAITFTGGEPTLYQDTMIDVYNKYRELADYKEEGGRLTLLTNGLIFPEKFLNNFFEKNEDKISVQISLDSPIGATDGRNCEFKGEIVKNIRKYKEKIDKVQVRTTLTKENVGYLFEMFRYTHEKLGVDLHFSVESASKIDLEIFETQIQKIVKYINENKIEDSFLSKKTRGVSKCSCGSSLVTVLWDGSVVPCPRWFSIHRKSEKIVKEGLEFENLDFSHVKSGFTGEYCIGGECEANCNVCTQSNFIGSGDFNLVSSSACAVNKIKSKYQEKILV